MESQARRSDIERLAEDATVFIEGIAHFAPGQAGKLARDWLVERDFWNGTVEDGERPTDLERWFAQGARMPGHELPDRAPAVAACLMAGTVEFVVAKANRA